MATYQCAISLIKRAAAQSANGGKIINLRSTKDTSLQTELYDLIVQTLRDTPRLEFTRILTYDSDSHVWMARRFLDELGDRRIGEQAEQSLGRGRVGPNMAVAQTAMLGGMPYKVLRDTISSLASAPRAVKPGCGRRRR